MSDKALRGDIVSDTKLQKWVSAHGNGKPGGKCAHKSCPGYEEKPLLET